ncbi:MAG: hypothetical protein K940chlam3_00389 [Chlamydiae bacterium]|nr:hypothetical protein [Chlamydiota bacterium]
MIKGILTFFLFLFFAWNLVPNSLYFDKWDSPTWQNKVDWVPEGSLVQRRVIVFYDSQVRTDSSQAKFHHLAEMPLNHLGIICDYHDIREPLPNITNEDDVIGVATWFMEYTILPYELADEYLKWAIQAVSLGKKYVILGNPAFDSVQHPMQKKKLNKFWNLIGLYDTGLWEGEGYSIKLIRNHSEMLDFERPYPDVIMGFRKMVQSSDSLTCYLTPRKWNEPESDACLVATGPNGGYVADNYANYHLYEKEREEREWYINRFSKSIQI